MDYARIAGSIRSAISHEWPRANDTPSTKRHRATLRILPLFSPKTQLHHTHRAVFVANWKKHAANLPHALHLPARPTKPARHNDGRAHMQKLRPRNNPLPHARHCDSASLHRNRPRAKIPATNPRTRSRLRHNQKQHAEKIAVQLKHRTTLAMH